MRSKSAAADTVDLQLFVVGEIKQRVRVYSAHSMASSFSVCACADKAACRSDSVMMRRLFGALWQVPGVDATSTSGALYHRLAQLPIGHLFWYTRTSAQAGGGRDPTVTFRIWAKVKARVDQWAKQKEFSPAHQLRCAPLAGGKGGADKSPVTNSHHPECRTIQVAPPVNSSGSIGYCGLVNVKNSYGEYVGFRAPAAGPWASSALDTPLGLRSWGSRNT
jgi:hypothetical protein